MYGGNFPNGREQPGLDDLHAFHMNSCSNEGFDWARLCFWGIGGSSSSRALLELKYPLLQVLARHEKGFSCSLAFSACSYLNDSFLA